MVGAIFTAIAGIGTGLSIHLLETIRERRRRIERIKGVYQSILAEIQEFDNISRQSTSEPQNKRFYGWNLIIISGLSELVMPEILILLRRIDFYVLNYTILSPILRKTLADCRKQIENQLKELTERRWDIKDVVNKD